MDTATETQTDHPPLPQREPGRAHRAAAIHSAATWLASSDVPMPDAVDIHHYAHARTVTERLAEVHAFADQHSLPVLQHGTTVWACLELAAAAEHGVVVRVSVLADTTDTREAWDRA